MRSNLRKRYAPASLESENTASFVAAFRKRIAHKIARFDPRLPTGFAVRSRTVSEVTSKDLEGVEHDEDNGIMVVPPGLVVTGTRLDSEEHNAVPLPVSATPGGLMCLPRELRDEIYTHLMSDMPTEIQIRHTSQYVCAPLKYLLAGTLPSLASANRQMHREVSLAWLRRTKLKITGSSCENYSCLYMFLEYLSDDDDEGFRSVRSLEYESLLWGFGKDPHGDFRQKAPFDIHKRCTGLTDLTIQIPDPRFYGLYTYLRSLELARDPLAQTSMTPLSHFEIRMQLRSVFDHPGSFRLKVVFAGIEQVSQSVEMRPRELLAARAQVLEGYRVERGSKVKLEIYAKHSTWKGYVEEQWMGHISREGA